MYKNFVLPTDDDEQKFTNYRLLTLDEVPDLIKNPVILNYIIKICY